MADDPQRNLFAASGAVDAERRAAVLGHGAHSLWFTGLSGSGKTTLAHAVEEALHDHGISAYVLDGDNTRLGLNSDLGFSPADRAENIRRVGHVARLLNDAGLVVLAAFISPYAADRKAVRDLHPAGGFSEVHVDVPVEVCEARDVKGLYARARSGEIPEFSGVSAPYEEPVGAELRVDTRRPIDECVGRVLAYVLPLVTR